MNPYLNVWATMLNLVKKFKDDYPQYELHDPMDFDANVSENEYPVGNLAGIFQLEYSEEGTLIEASCVFPLSVPADRPLHELNELTGLMVMKLRMNVRHPFYDYKSGQQIGLMTCGDALRVSPVVTTENRQFKYVQQTFKFDRSSSFLPA